MQDVQRVGLVRSGFERVTHTRTHTNYPRVGNVGKIVIVFFFLWWYFIGKYVDWSDWESTHSLKFGVKARHRRPFFAPVTHNIHCWAFRPTVWPIFVIATGGWVFCCHATIDAQDKNGFTDQKITVLSIERWLNLQNGGKGKRCGPSGCNSRRDDPERAKTTKTQRWV